MKNLGIIIPVYNEANRLKKTFRALSALKLPRGVRLQEVLFINDGSTDTTKTLIDEYIKTSLLPLRIVSYKKNRGKGYAVRRGMLLCEGDIVLIADADMSTEFSELKKLMPSLERGADVVIGTRKNGSSTVTVHQPWLREKLGRAFTYFTRFVLRLPITDFTCGFKVFTRETITPVFSHAVINRWGYDAEILYLTHHHGFTIRETPVQWADDRRSHVNMVTAVPATLWEILRITLIHSVLPSIRVGDTKTPFARLSHRLASIF